MDSRACPNCGTPFEAADAQGLCPACLMAEGLKPSDPDPIRTALQEKLRGQYRLVRLLGRGGMGAVYLARDLTLEREVAIKVLKANTASREVHDRLRREARTAARLTHPNIVPLHAFGEVESLPYVVMGYVRGESLAARLRRDGRMPEEEARRAMAEIADALDHAHRQGVIHRDVKPDNVLLDDETGRALLTDFGVARALGTGETLAGVGAIVGTPHFMSPEQAAGRADIDGRSDVYSLGVTGYTMLTGRLPFDAPTAGDVLRMHLTQEPPPLRRLAPTLADSTVQVVERCLAKDPARRFSDARAIHRALGVPEESRLPDGLRAVQGKGVAASLVAGALLGFVASTGAPGPVLALVSGVTLAEYVAVLLMLKREGFSLRQSQHAIWTEPSWWLWWYPSGLRRPGNVWSRLPVSVRRLRFWLPAFVLYVAGFTATYLFMNAVLYPPHISTALQLRLFLVTLAGILALDVIGLFARYRARRELKARGLTAAEVDRFATTVPPSRLDFWARPHIAALLLEAAPPAAPRPDVPHDLVQAILRDGDDLPGPLRPLGAQAASTARQLVASIEDAEREMAEVGRSFEPGEDERIAGRIEALGDGEDAGPLRALLEKQREIIGDLQGRLAAANGRRNRRLELLRTLALHVASLRARAATPASVGSLSDEVRAICDEISRQASPLGASASVEATPTATMGARRPPDS